MTLSRREFTLLSSATAVGLLAANAHARTSARLPSTAAGTYFDWKPIGTAAWAAFGEGGNSLVVASKGELVLIDTKFAAFATGLRRESESRASASKHTLKLVINTHHHGDHTGGNLGFANDTPILAHENANPRIESQLDRYRQSLQGHAAQLAQSDKPGAKDMLDATTKLVDAPDSMTAAMFLPTTSFATQHEAKVGDTTIELRHFGTGHTDNDAVVFFPSLNLLHMGDLLFHKVHPFIDVSAGSNSTGWMESCRKALALCNDTTVVVPGHGELTDKSGLQAQITYFETVRAAVKAAIDAGKPKDEVTKMTIDSLKDYGSTRLAMVLGAIFDELAPKR